MRGVWGLLCFLAIAPTAMAEQLDVAAGIEYFQWQEFNDRGDKLLEEGGPRSFIQLAGRNALDADWQIDFGVRLFSGTVGYDGQTMSGSPVGTDTDYNGLRTELGFTRDLGAGMAADSLWQLRLALGLEQWRRSLHDTALADGTPVLGYVERYSSTYARLGLNYRRERVWAVGFGAKAPLSTNEKVDLGAVAITLEPEGQLSLFVQAELPLTPAMNMTMEYDSYRFAKSDPVSGYYQPKSWQDSVGVALHYRF
jgi:hypothetical protein